MARGRPADAASDGSDRQFLHGHPVRLRAAGARTVGTGTNRINERTIGESAQGLARYILDADPKGKLAKRGVAIAYDVRPHSKAFAQLTAQVLAGNGVRAYLFDKPRPTPELSFAIRHLKCASGVVVTASHNPPTDNGFKAYWSDGGQVVAPHDVEILKRVAEVQAIRKKPLAKARREGLIQTIGTEVDDAYFARFPRDLWLSDERAARIVYSPLHGTGVTIVPRALREMGFNDVVMPPHQAAMDGTFPTVPDHYPNPEEPRAMARAVELGEQLNADLVIATDPRRRPARRVRSRAGPAVPLHHGQRARRGHVPFYVGVADRATRDAEKAVRSDHARIHAIDARDLRAFQGARRRRPARRLQAHGGGDGGRGKQRPFGRVCLRVRGVHRIPARHVRAGQGFGDRRGDVRPDGGASGGGGPHGSRVSGRPLPRVRLLQRRSVLRVFARRGRDGENGPVDAFPA
ncbi:MAG: hypothetical protein M5R36_16385 [Deltaproteobacteria bacterium]|nr:hypothetical protein [Deltaproteobacteria bacterium]